MTIMNSQSLQILLAGMLRDPSGLKHTKVNGISLDSRTLNAGDLFVSLATDISARQRHLQQALSNNLSAVLYDHNLPLSDEEQELLRTHNTDAHAVKQLADKCGEIAARFYGHPSMALTIIAVTGTNGKTSVTQFIAQSLESLSMPCGVMGTIGVGRVGALNHNGMTTPDPISVQRELAGFCHQGIKYAVIEASSHALSQGRLNSVDIDVAVFTNLTRDHLDYHKTMANYAAAKAHLFEFKTLKTAIINAADTFGQSLIEKLTNKTSVELVTYSRLPLDEHVGFQANNSLLTANGIQFDVVTSEFKTTIDTALLGEFNIDNLLATSASLKALNIEHAEIISALEKCTAIDGRMDVLGGHDDATVVIDFAHTPDALIQVLTSLRAHIKDGAKLLCVFGCGGNRDSGKRPLMAAAVEKYADQFVITDDNPRDEQAEKIVNDIISGLENKLAVVEHDRKLAITSIIKQASKGDIVLIAGKGHEQYQEIAGIKHSFSDKKVAQQALTAANDSSADKAEASA
jgi:UDP-N-acetylmuramoyl-L-alanyl-D-glutamate--2,6-diaminopimelate ligase